MTQIHDIDNATSIYIQEQEGKRTTSIIGQAIQYDKLNDRINPTDGYRIRLDFDFYGLVGDAEHINAELKLSNFYRIDDQLILANFIEGGFIALQQLPDYYKHLLYIACSASFGIKGAKGAMGLIKKK